MQTLFILVIKGFMLFILQILVPVYAGDVRQIYVPIEPVETGVVPIKVNAMCVVAGHSVTHTVNVGVSKHLFTHDFS